MQLHEEEQPRARVLMIWLHRLLLPHQLPFHFQPPAQAAMRLTAPHGQVWPMPWTEAQHRVRCHTIWLQGELLMRGPLSPEQTCTDLPTRVQMPRLRNGPASRPRQERLQRKLLFQLQKNQSSVQTVKGLITAQWQGQPMLLTEALHRVNQHTMGLQRELLTRDLLSPDPTCNDLPTCVQLPRPRSMSPASRPRRERPPLRYSMHTTYTQQSKRCHLIVLLLWDLWSPHHCPHRPHCSQSASHVTKLPSSWPVSWNKTEARVHHRTTSLRVRALMAGLLLLRTRQKQPHPHIQTLSSATVHSCVPLQRMTLTRKLRCPVVTKMQSRTALCSRPWWPVSWNQTQSRFHHRMTSLRLVAMMACLL
mmetsp:Transcript_57163/g.152469  ORF Transcript_57163/g.152469 Transcript_57163/m.152469 type:complete len:363 (+) Transcript_57163:1474-2562(+)